MFVLKFYGKPEHTPQPEEYHFIRQAQKAARDYVGAGYRHKRKGEYHYYYNMTDAREATIRPAEDT